MSNTTDVAIVGGGVIGCSIAYQLAKRGIKSTMFEKDRLASGASGATAGIIGPLWYVDRTFEPYSEMGMRSLDSFPQLAAELMEAGVDPEFRQNGVLKLALTEELHRELEQNLAWQGELGLGVTWLDRDEVIEREPAVNPDVMGGVFSPQEGCIRGESYVNSLAHAARRLGATVLEGVEVTGLVFDGDKVAGVRTAVDTYDATLTVLAAGPWTGIADRWIPLRIPVRPVKGQRILVRKDGFLPRSTVQAVIPQVDGNVLIGATREEGVFDHRITTDGIGDMAQAAAAVFPTLNDADFVAARAGVRPGSPDGMPIVGPLPEWPGLSVASGHDHAGIMLSPETGRLMADYIESGDAGPLEPFSPLRFDSGDDAQRVARPLFWNVTYDS